MILLVALVVLGPEQLPKAMRTLGRAMAEIRKVSSGFQTEMRNAMDSIDSPARETLGAKQATGAGDPTTAPSSATSGSSTDPARSATPASEARIDEVSARNESPGDGSDPGESAGSDSAATPSDPGSGLSAADRAAG